MTMSKDDEQDPEENGFDGLAEGPEGDQPMSFWDHMAELRKRLIWAFGSVAVGFLIAIGFVRPLLDFLRVPLIKAWAGAALPGGPELQVLQIQGALMVDIRLAITAGIFIGIPMVSYQVWLFVSPGLYKKEKRFVIPFVFFTALMFAVGGWFAYSYVLPFAIQWLLNYPAGSWMEKLLFTYGVGGDGVIYKLELAEYVKASTRILLAFAAVFEMPLLAAFLAKVGLITHRTLLKFWKVSILIIFVVAAFLTPPEPVTQLMMALPMVALFFVSVGVAYVINPGAKEYEAEEYDDDDDDEPEED